MRAEISLSYSVMMLQSLEMCQTGGRGNRQFSNEREETYTFFLDLRWGVHLYFSFHLVIFKDFIHLFLERGREREERKRNINVWLPLVCPLPGTWPKTQACALTGIKLAALWFAGWHSIHWATPARAIFFL